MRRGREYGDQDDGWSPLIAAASLGNTAAVELLCSEGANINGAHGGVKRTALVSAAFYGMVGPMEVLLRRGADPDAQDAKGASALILAAMRGHTAAVELLCRHCKALDARDEPGKTALMYAAEYGYVEIASLICDAGASVLAETEAMATALHFAACFGHAEVLRFLCDKVGNAPVAIDACSDRRGNRRSRYR